MFCVRVSASIIRPIASALPFYFLLPSRPGGAHIADFALCASPLSAYCLLVF